MDKPSKRAYPLGLLLFVLGAILFYRLDSWGVTETSEARYAEIAWEMYHSGDYLHPRLLEIGHYHKPPLTYWITVVAYHLFGVSAWSARVFLQLALLVQVGLVFRIGRLLFNDRTIALGASVVYASMPAVIIGTRGLTTDTYLATWVLLFVWAWLAFKRRGDYYYVLIAYAALGLGFLTKGPVVLIVPLSVAWAINQLIRGGKAPGWLHALGVLLMLLIGLSWFIKLYTENAQFLDYFVLDHTVRRLATNQFGRNKPFWFYWMLVPPLAFPWFLMILPPLFKNLRQPVGLPHLFLSWVVVPLVFFSIARSKLILYVLPVFPGIALMTAWYWFQLDSVLQKKWTTVFVVFAFVVVLGLLVTPAIVPTLYYTPLMYGMIGLIAALALTTARVTTATNYQLPWATFALTMTLTVFATHFLSNNPSLARDQRRVAAYLRRHYPSRTPVLVYNERLPSLAFGLQRPTVSLYDGDRSLQRETQFEQNRQWQRTLINLPEVGLPERYLSGAVVVAKTDDPLPKDFSRYRLDTTLDGWNIYTNPYDSLPIAPPE